MPERIENLVHRARIVRAVRAFFDARGFVEVETPVRIAAPAPEPYIDCPPCGKAFLRASPELQMKNLLAAGLTRIYQIGPCFRDGEKGRRHNPEFTMLEWYRRDATYRDIAADLSALLAALAPAAGPVATLTVRDAYRTLAGWDPWERWDADRFDVDMATKIEPNLPEGPLFLTDYPRQAASLAKIRGDVAERWEFYWKRIELANCFTELCDADEQRARFIDARRQRQTLGEADYPLDEAFLARLPRIGAAAGVALGIDRLVMLLCGAPDIASVRAEALWASC
jgi:lysyl-tRNA synthetase class 2